MGEFCLVIFSSSTAGPDIDVSMLLNQNRRDSHLDILPVAFLFNVGKNYSFLMNSC